MKKSLKLYNYAKSSASFRVRIALNLKKVEYDYISINIFNNEHNKDSYVKINPQRVKFFFFLL